MFNVRDLFQWERFITPSLIRTFYALTVIVALAVGGSSLFGAIGLVRISPIAGGIMVLASILGTVLAIIAARILSEFVLIMFRINDHLGALRARAEG